MGFGKIGFSQAGDAAAPSGSIWGDCPNSLLRDLGLGYFNHEEFLGGPIDSSLADGEPLGGTSLTVDGDTGALSQKAGEQGGYVTVTTGATDNDAIALYSAPLGKIVKNSGNKLWFETRLEATTLFDGGIFVGVGEEAAAVRDVIADNPSNTAQATLIGESLVGFVTAQASSALATVDAVYKKDAGTAVTVKASAGTLAAATEIKLGVYFNGRDTISFYVDGSKVGSVEVDSTVDQSKNLAAIVAVKSGSASAKSISIDWIRYGFQARN